MKNKVFHFKSCNKVVLYTHLKIHTPTIIKNYPSKGICVNILDTCMKAEKDRNKYVSAIICIIATMCIV